MVYFTYSQVAFVTVLAFAATISVESLNEKEIKFILNRIKAKILSQRASLRGQLEKYTDCLETAYKYKWGQLTFNGDQGALDDTRRCCQQEAAAYHDLKELKEQIEGVFYHNYLFSAQV
ncbi:unnamed protein product [Trichobilharzia szidati]|nr:unnamed protein product [Trichobilharzia szidati]